MPYTSNFGSKKESNSLTQTTEAQEIDWPFAEPSCSSARRPSSCQDFSGVQTFAGSPSHQPIPFRQRQSSSSIAIRRKSSSRSSTASSTSTVIPSPVATAGFASSSSSPRSIRPNFVSPFKAGLPIIPLTYGPASPLYLPATPSSEGESPAISPCTLSSPGILTPFSQDSKCLTPFEAAFQKKIFLDDAKDRELPLSPRSMISKALRLPPPPEASVLLSPVSPTSPTKPLAVPAFSRNNSAQQLRRRSVDVGMLVNARSGRTNQKDASAAAFLPPEQLRAHRAHRQSTQRQRESLFAQHLTSILSHSLSLCAAGGQEFQYDPELSSPETSPRSSISTSSAEADLASSNTSQLYRQRLSSLPSVSSKRRLELIDCLGQWAFDANELNQDELCECACIIFECVLTMDGLDSSLDIHRMRPLILSLRSAYHPRNAYHNFAHAVDVTQACYSFLKELKLAPPLSVLTDSVSKGKWHRDSKSSAIGSLLKPMHVLALLVAAIGHDVGHPGLSNAYMVNARTPAAQVYNDKSVLENFHSVTLARMLKIHGFGHLLESENGTTEFRQVLLASVLATDMSRHFPFVGKLTELGTRFKSEAYRSENPEDDRLLICSGLMKCADISNPTRPHKVARQWSTALLEEWSVQAQIEAKFKLPISVVILDPEERVAQAKSQVGFINLFTQPLFDAMTSVAPAFHPFSDACREGRAIWESLVISPDNCLPAPLSSLSTESSHSTPKPSSMPSFATSTSSSPTSLPPSTGFSSRLPPHRAPRLLKHIDATRANAFDDHNSPHSGCSTSSRSTSPGAPSIFDRTGSISSVTTNASWISPSSVDDCLSLGDEECTGDCSSVTAACEKCTPKFAEERQQLVKGFYGSPMGDGVWPPSPFRPRQATGEPAIAT